jgi:fused signal recognition particle receptor
VVLRRRRRDEQAESNELEGPSGEDELAAEELGANDAAAEGVDAGDDVEVVLEVPDEAPEVVEAASEVVEPAPTRRGGLLRRRRREEGELAEGVAGEGSGDGAAEYPADRAEPSGDLEQPVSLDAVESAVEGEVEVAGEAQELEVVEEAGDRPVRLKGRLRRALAAPFTSIRGRGRVDDAVLEELEEALLLADVGLGTTTGLIATLRERARGKDSDVLIDTLRELTVEMFAGDDPQLRFSDEGTTVWLFVGVNGVGKTTTIGKLARREADLGRRVVLAAGDTFRAAAGEQLELWATRTGTDIVEGADGADPSSVVYDAIAHAAATGADLVLADTAGRLHTKTNLMVELQKIRRVADRPPGKVTEVLLVLDATTGQNGLVQARQFTEAVGVTGVVLTKLDGTARGGIVLAIRTELGLPIKLVGLGEGEHDLVPFDPREFAEELIG